MSAHAQGGFRPKAGFVPNEKVALLVGRAVLAEIYGEKQIQSEDRSRRSCTLVYGR